MSLTPNIAAGGSEILTEAIRLASQLPVPPQAPSQEPAEFGFLGSFGVTALNVAEGLKVATHKIDRFVRTIFDEVLAFAASTKAVITDVFSSFERVETTLGRNPLLDPMASIGRAWNAAAPGAEGAEPAQPAATMAPEPPAQESAATRYKTKLLSKIEGIEHKVIKLQDIALKIIKELCTRVGALTNFVAITLSSLKEIGKVFNPKPLSSPELEPLFDTISRLFKSIAGKPAQAQAPSSSV